MAAGTAQSAQRLATGWTVRGSNPGGGETYRIRPDRLWCPPSLLYNGYRVFPGGKVRPGRGVDHTTHLAPRLKKEYRYTSTPLFAFVACSRVKNTVYIYICVCVCVWAG